MSFTTTPLYGGAIAVDLPTGFLDANNIRQVPDHQEVYLDNAGYTSLVFEILQRVEKPDNEALQYHFTDLTEDTGDSTTVLEQGNAVLGKMSTTPLLTLTFVQTPAPPPPNARPKKEPEFVAIHLLLLRLAAQTTDILITINVPHYAGEYVKAEEGANGVTQLMREGEAVKNKVLESFEVRDWGLFRE
ncbi:Mog1p/PsbP-like protein [Melanomma pulvis-pyrius CBS 109.77]|uniref:Mog1p/PsbP-like protein n=1 Tax=Melanomma pulvis-pyrius CBS 109.77 TaxID=1314802 RepID=A0A6A6WV44_9PLEO|nr:Mog1p/PsbP-like protein [Melanomma pulvis-pyrius CBS 109.77]